MASTDSTIQSADVKISGVLDMRENQITGMNVNTAEYPANPSDGATKIYVDEQRDAIIASIPNEIDNGSF